MDFASRNATKEPATTMATVVPGQHALQLPADLRSAVGSQTLLGAWASLLAWVCWTGFHVSGLYIKYPRTIYKTGRTVIHRPESFGTVLDCL